MNDIFIVIVAVVIVIAIASIIIDTWSARQCALEAREEEREDALKRTLAPTHNPDHGSVGGADDNDVSALTMVMNYSKHK